METGVAISAGADVVIITDAMAVVDVISITADAVTDGLTVKDSKMDTVLDGVMAVMSAALKLGHHFQEIRVPDADQSCLAEKKGLDVTNLPK